jgi:hypothetical protein
LLARRRDKLSRISTSAEPAANTEQGLFQWLLDGMRKLHDLTF